jgi:hypothetical protein
MTVLAALALCLQIDGVDLPPIELTEPPVIEIRAAETRLSLGAWDRRALARELRGRGFTAAQVAAALAPFRLVDPTTEALRCGECTTGGFDLRSQTCIAGLKRSPCTACKICSDPAPEPIAEVRP